MTRISLVDPENATDAEKEVFAAVASTRGNVSNLFRTMGHSVAGTRRAGDMGSFLRFESTLPGRLRESVILTVAGRWGCDYERLSHEPIARELGLSDAALADLRQGMVPGELSPVEAAAVRYAQVLSREGRTPDDLFEPLRQGLDEEGIVELHLLTGYYTMIAFFLNGLEVGR